MSSDKRCCVPGCKGSGVSGMHAVLHGFPNPEKDRLRFNTWLYSIGSDILGLENTYIFKNRRVCHIHFEDKYLCRNNRISNIAVPTLHLPGVNLVSQPKLSCVGRKPLQELVNQPIPSTSTGRKISSGKPKLSRPEIIIQAKIMAAKTRINKLKNKVKKQTAEIKAAKKFVANPRVLDMLQNCSSTAKLLMRIQLREDLKKDKGRRFSLQEKCSIIYL